MKYKLLEVIVCPVCHENLWLDKEKKELVCRLDNLGFPIRNGIPVLLRSEARNLMLHKDNI